MLSVKDKLDDPSFALGQIPTETVLILQGGGALGAFECGVVRPGGGADFRDVVAGVSIGALNGAVIAGNPRHATAALEAFWADLAVITSGRRSPTKGAAASMKTIMFGVPNFFKPRWLAPFYNPMELPWNWTSYYDAAPMKGLISKYVDFAALKAIPVRCGSARSTSMTAELEVFDSYVDDRRRIMSWPAEACLRASHGRSSTARLTGWRDCQQLPLDLVMDHCGPDGKRVYIVHLYAGKRPLPANMMEAMARRDEIVYSERIRSDLRTREIVSAYRGLIDEILANVGPDALAKIKQRPRYIELMGDGAPMSITRFGDGAACGPASA